MLIQLTVEQHNPSSDHNINHLKFLVNCCLYCLRRLLKIEAEIDRIVEYKDRGIDIMVTL